MDEIYCSNETESTAQADFVPQGTLLDTSKDRLDNPSVGDKVRQDYNLPRGSNDKPDNGDNT